MSEQPRYQTLRDYLDVIRTQRWLVLLLVVVFGGAALAYSVRQDPEYEAETSVAFKEVTEDLRLLGLPPQLVEGPPQRAAINAQRVTRAEVAQRVKEKLRLSSPIEELQNAVTVQPEAQTNLVVITARAGSAELAARLANEFGRQAQAVVQEELDEQLAAAARSVRESQRDAIRRGGNEAFVRATFADRLARIDGLRDFGKPAEISRFAEVPGSPVSPKPVRNTALGLLIGLALGLLAAFVRDSLDIRLRGSHEIQAHVKLPVVGHIGTDAMGGTPLPSRNGRAELSAEDLESFRILRKNVEFLDIDRPLRTIAVTSALPEEGKSTVAASLAYTYALAGKRTLLVECDLRRPSLAERLGAKPAPGLTDYLIGERAGPQDVLQGVPLPALNGKTNGSANGGEASESGEELVFIAAGTPVPRPGDVLASKRFQDFLAQVSEAYDVVVLDTSPLLSVSDTLELLPSVDAVLLCIRAGRTTRDEARAAKAALEHLAERPAGLVVTGIKPGDEAQYGYYSSAHTYGSASAS